MPANVDAALSTASRSLPALSQTRPLPCLARTAEPLEQLALRFGAVPAAVEARIRSAGIEELDSIGIRVLTAQTLDEALAVQ